MASNQSGRITVSILALSFIVTAFFVQVLTGKTAESAKVKDGGSASGSGTMELLLVKGNDQPSVTIIEYGDFTSTASRAGSRILDQVLKAYPDDVQVVFKPYPSSARPEALLAQEGAMAAAAQGKFWPMHDKLMIHHGTLTQDVLVRYATELGLNLESFKGQLGAHEYRDRILHVTAEAQGFGVTRAPTFFVNGRKLVGPRPFAIFKQIIDGELGLTGPVQGGPEETAGQRVDVPVGKAPARGPSDAPITIVEYSDFQCPFCGRAAPTMDQLMKDFDGKVRWVFKHFPLPIHPDAPLAHQVALAADEQGKFWEMHDLIFANQRKIKRDDLLEHARSLGLDVGRIEKEVDAGKFKPMMEADLQEGQRLGVRATPTFFINGRRVVGAVPIEAFKQVINEELSSAESE